MAKPKLVKTGTGQISPPGNLTMDKEGKVTKASLSQMNLYLKLLADKINNGMSLGNGINLSKAGNLDAQIIEFRTPGVANTEIAVDHSLDRVPIGYIPIMVGSPGGILYVSNFGGWSVETVYFKCTAASVLFNIIIF